MRRFSAIFYLVLACVYQFAWSAPPPGYYDSAEGLIGSSLEAALHDIIDNHTSISYSQTDDVMRVIDEDPLNSNNVELIYSIFSMDKSAFGSSGSSVWNREHTWPRSYCLDLSGVDNSDLHNLFPCNASVNSSRGNKYFDITTPPGTQNSVSPENTFDSDSWEPSGPDKGIVARAAFYMAVRYDGSDPNTSDLKLGESPNTATHTFGKISTLLEWNRTNPPNAFAAARNDALYYGVQTTVGFRQQGNRNPFIDYPQLADAVFLDANTLTWHRWQVISFSFAQLDNDTISGPTADPDADGYINLMEFIGNTNPLAVQNYPFFEVTETGGTLSITYRKVKNLDLSGISCQWQVSTDLTNWTTASPLISTQSDEGDTPVERLESAATEQVEFWRLRAVKTF